MSKITMLIIDPQVDFHPGGSLGIPNANNDAERTADFILDHLEDIDQIIVTLDSHHRMHVAHSMVWLDQQDNHPAPFTLITNQQIRDGVWRPKDPTFLVHFTDMSCHVQAGFVHQSTCIEIRAFTFVFCLFVGAVCLCRSML
mmetsp:Transcript_16000/g.26835  ORF Transcript_16000/g.26835 Transcript_16000/m.26835 type:complete len:142 (-) Transcript_16000:624-1049(-)